ncbi:MAG: hypothetical protein JXN61_04180 [Sedimentisphaerales bacterium]|nr:hypothetical protein [Sedimentisphaerales bacterium]
MKVILSISLFLALLTVALPCAQAVPTNILDLTSLGSEGLINGALFQTADLRSSGTGVFQTFLKFGHDDDKDQATLQAYNTDARPFEAGFAMNNSPQHTRQLPLIAVPYYDFDVSPLRSSIVTTGLYYEFLLDINQKGAIGNDDDDADWNLSLDQLIIALRDNPNESSFSTIFADPIYEMDGLADWRVIVNGKLDTGSGQANMAVYIPKSLFDGHAGEYVYLYALFGEGGDIPNNDGFEEWAIESEFELSIIPAPGAILLGGIGAGLVGWLRRRRAL